MIAFDIKSNYFSRVRKHARALVFAGLALFSATHGAHAYNYSYFDMTETFSSDVTPFPKWTGMVSRHDEQRVVSEDECGTERFQPCQIKDWKKLVQDLQGKKLPEQLERINNWGNEHPYIVDQMNWGVEDFWETPNEFMAVNGDCEDYAIAKYYSLRSMGVSADRLRIMVVQDFNLGGVIHAILGVYDGKSLMILDNQIKQVMPADRIYHYKPIFGINEDGWWAYHPKQL